jgi:hypothetical protein
MDFLYATQKETNYENFEATCPYCDHLNIYNRVSDLADTTPIAFRTVSCQNEQCSKQFNINGDSINSAYEMLILDCDKLMSIKRYSLCIISLAQAYEAFFNQYLQVELLFKPFAKSIHQYGFNRDNLNRLSELLYENTKSFAYMKMRNVFLNMIIINRSFSSILEAEITIRDLKSSSNNLLTKEPKDALIATINNNDILHHVRTIANSKISTLRNQVVHKNIYRPTRQEVELAITEARNTIFPLGIALEINFNDINWYISRYR